MPATLVQEDFRTLLRENLRLTVDDWDLLPDDGNRYEIIDGDTYIASAPDIVHQIISTKATRHIGRADASKCVSVEVQ